MDFAQFENPNYGYACERIKKAATPLLKSLEFAIELIEYMPHIAAGRRNVAQRQLDASLLRWLIQRELDRRQAGELPYSWQAYSDAIGIPEE